MHKNLTFTKALHTILNYYSKIVNRMQDIFAVRPINLHTTMSSKFF